jgi:hypothetical protein
MNVFELGRKRRETRAGKVDVEVSERRRGDYDACAGRASVEDVLKCGNVI